MRKQKKQGFLRLGSRKKLFLRGRQNYYPSALKLLLKSQSNPLIVSIQPLPSMYTKNFLNQASVTKELLKNFCRISDVLFEVVMQSEREEPANLQMMYGGYGNNSYCNVNTTPLQGQSYMEMLNNPLQKYFVIIIYTLGII